ncbi:hypothetical protein BV25DRAFT_701330 [Artomyces pyxidatus]|uniref:Uncharacterized protein n=1 Tax=Artomyces pyxidatus TaxID=48021 RepID=A0ACB8T2C8_9AGAM|nr:hypothetical protein BV25DRAFT_701330 [Artomyces pyxidatus]
MQSGGLTRLFVVVTSQTPLECAFIRSRHQKASLQDLLHYSWACSSDAVHRHKPSSSLAVRVIDLSIPRFWYLKATGSGLHRISKYTAPTHRRAGNELHSRFLQGEERQARKKAGKEQTRAISASGPINVVEVEGIHADQEDRNIRRGYVWLPQDTYNIYRANTRAVPSLEECEGDSGCMARAEDISFSSFVRRRLADTNHPILS